MKYRFEVIEDNGGGLSLWIFKGSTLVFGHTGYEYFYGQLCESIRSLEDGGNPEGWDGNDFSIGDYRAILEHGEGFRIIYDNKDIYPELMGAAGRLEFLY